MSRKLIKVDAQYFDVLEETETHYICYPCGGGFQHTIPKTAADPCAYESSWAPGEVCIDSEGSGWFRCMLDHNYRWNGWADPYFEKEELLRFLKAEGFVIEGETEHAIQFYYKEQPDENHYTAEQCDIEGQELWNINGWCFLTRSDCDRAEVTA
jgi:hypothetical protein